MSYDMNRINSIENQLNTNPDNLSNNDLIYYLKYNSNNTILDPNNIDNTAEYLKKINNSFFYENIFVNTSNYSSILMAIIGLLLPFYYFFPRFYTIGFIGILIGIFSFSGLYSITTSLYSNFNGNINLIFIGLTLGIYIVFFVVLNKLNHFSLLFISAILAFVFINYFMRVYLTVPLLSNPYNNFRATMNNNTNYTQYNTLIETTCFKVISRFNLNLPSGNMLYSYLTVFDIGDNSNKIPDFITNLLSPLVSILILFMLGNFLSKVTNDNISKNPLKLFPLIGIDRSSTNLLCCQANYILPREFNVSLMIENLLAKYNFDDKIYDKVQKALLRVSNELLKKYNPKFTLLDNVDKNIINSTLKENKIFIRINKILKKNNIEFNLNYLDEIRHIIEENNIPLQEKNNMFDLLNKIDNTLLITNKENVDYNNDAQLAKDELLYDKEINEKVKPLLENIVDTFIKNYLDNLHLKEASSYGLKNLNGRLLFGYDYNIMTYSWLSQNVRLYSNKIFAFIMTLISTWIIFAKPIGSPLLIVKYIMTEQNGLKHFINQLFEGSFIWKYFSMGLDTSYFEDEYKNINNNKEESLLTSGLNILYTILIFILLMPIFYMYNSINFGLSLSPSWYNLLYQIVFIINILGNVYTYLSKGSILLFNIKFLIGFIITFIVISVIFYAINIQKNNI